MGNSARTKRPYIVMIMQQPNWNKLSPELQTLSDKPWKFGLFKALNLLESEWAEGDEMQTGLSSRVLITPYKELGFPASDIKKGNLLTRGRGVFHIETNYSGLYGADAAMPHYVLEQAASDNEAGGRTRAFLDMFNHLYYCLLYQSWKKSQLTIDGIGAQQFDQILNAILSGQDERETNAGVAVLKTSSASGMAKLLNDEFKSEQIIVDDSSPHWQSIESPSIIGDKDTTELGGSFILGESVLVSGGKVLIKLGGLAESEAKGFFPGQDKGNKLQRLITSQLPSDLPWECIMNIKHDFKACQQLGDNSLILGVSSHVGEVSQTIEFQQFKDSQYKQRMASTI